MGDQQNISVAAQLVPGDPRSIGLTLRLTLGRN